MIKEKERKDDLMILEFTNGDIEKFDKVIMKKVYGTDDGKSPCFFYWRTIWKSQRKTSSKIISEPKVKSGLERQLLLINGQRVPV